MLIEVRRKFKLLRDRVMYGIRGSQHVSRVFSEIHVTNAWGHAETVSGPGSSLENTATLRRALPSLVTRYGLKRVVDAPCGDFNWMKTTVDIFDEYTGVDIVPELIAANHRQFGGPRVRFECADITRDYLPSCDLIICRDGFIHLPTRLIRDALRSFRSTGASHLLLSNDSREFEYQEIPTGGLRPINFRKPPFNFPEPLETILEDNYEGRQICLWRLDEIG